MGLPGESYLLTSREVQDLLRIHRSTLHDWRSDGRLQGVQLFEDGPWRYPAHQGVIARALAAVRGAR
jgi:predicted site-specific integrase-resolvase